MWHIVALVTSRIIYKNPHASVGMVDVHLQGTSAGTGLGPATLSPNLTTPKAGDSTGLHRKETFCYPLLILQTEL